MAAHFAIPFFTPELWFSNSDQTIEIRFIMQNSPLKVAVIGLRHGISHVTVLRGHSRACVTALVDLDPIALEKAARSCSGVTTYTDVAEMAESGVADIAVIAVPTAAHATVAEICLKAGMHVLLEKPLCRTVEEAEFIQRAHTASGKILQVGYEVRSSPLHRSIMQHIANGDLGTVTNVWWNQYTDQGKPAYGGWRKNRADMGGALFDCSVHYLDLISQWAGAPLARLVALGNVSGQSGVCPVDRLPESAAISLDYANGVRGTFSFGGINSFNDDAIFGIAGTSGCIRGNPIGAGHYELRTDGGVRVSEVRFDPQLTSSGHLGFAEQWDFFLDSILEGTPNVCPFEDALTVHRMMMALDKSLGSNEVIVF